MSERASRVQISPLPQKETSESERWEEARAEGAGVGKRARRFATNWDGTGAAKWADLSRTKGFVPIFWTNDLIWYKSEEEDKKLACFVSKIHSRKGSTAYDMESYRKSRLMLKENFEVIIPGHSPVIDGGTLVNSALNLRHF